jgi:hypothetical protein
VTPDRFADVEDACRLVENAIDDLGDQVIPLLERSLRGDDLTRLKTLADERIARAAASVNALAAVVDEARSLSRHLVVAPEIEGTP